MKGYLVAIDNEIKSYYDLFVKDSTAIDGFVNNSIAVLDYYCKPIFLNGKNVIRKKLALSKVSDLTEKEEEFLSSYKDSKLGGFKDLLSTAIKECFDDRKDDKEFYDQLIEIVVGNCIKLFRYGQLTEYRNNNIEYVNVITDANHSCSHCQTLSKFHQSVRELMDNTDRSHPYCVFLMDPEMIISTQSKMSVGNTEFINVPTHLVERIKAVMAKLKISVPKLLTAKVFEFVNDIVHDERFIETLSSKYSPERVSELQDKLNGNINMFILKDRILISSGDLGDIDYTVIKCLLIDKLESFDQSWWETNYDNKQSTKYIGDNASVYKDGFVNFIAEENFSNYFIESAVYYIYNPSLLKNIDLESYNKLKNEVFSGIEFLKE